jgi:hypothetical protein
MEPIWEAKTATTVVRTSTTMVTDLLTTTESSTAANWAGQQKAGAEEGNKRQLTASQAYMAQVNAIMAGCNEPASNTDSNSNSNNDMPDLVEHHRRMPLTGMRAARGLPGPFHPAEDSLDDDGDSDSSDDEGDSNGKAGTLE